MLGAAVASLAAGREVLTWRSRLAPPGIPPPANGCQLSSGSLSCSSFFSPASSASYFPLTALGLLLGAGHSGEVGGRKAGEESQGKRTIPQEQRGANLPTPLQATPDLSHHGSPLEAYEREHVASPCPALTGQEDTHSRALTQLQMVPGILAPAWPS